MALGGIPPWLNVNPQNFVAAAQAGTALGLRIAEQQNQADHAARAEASRRWELEQRLRQEANELAARREEAAAALEATNRYRIGMLANQAEENAVRKAHYDAMAEAARRRGTEPKIHFGANGEVLSATDGQVDVLRPGTPRLSPTDYVTVRTPAVKGEEGIPASPAIKKSLFGIDWLRKDLPAQPAIPGTPGTPETSRLIPVSQFDEGMVMPPSAGTTPKASPFKEGQLIRNKKDGKLYRVQDGVPVLAE